MKLTLFNSLSRQKEVFRPIKSGQVSMYVCGPTVYSAPHLGNGLSIVVFDILYRILINLYGKDAVTYIRNITYVDDKINDEAKKRKITIQALTEQVTSIFHQNVEALGCLAPNEEPKATAHISKMIDIISRLIANDYAYISNDHVYFSVRKADKYGELSGKNINELLNGARVEVSPGKKDAADFVLWKPVDENYDPSSVFDSPWGKGRPGWHIECSAMSHMYLGENFDIHGGGVDLSFPHHTNEIAQSCAAFPGSKYANYWVHNGFLTVTGEKMSKSLGNFITMQELLDKGIDGEVIRYVLSSSHYRKPTDWNNNILTEAKKSLDNFYRVIDILLEEEQDKKIDEIFLSALLDDLNTPKAYARLHELATLANKAVEGSDKKHYALLLKSSSNLIGLLKYKPKDWFHSKNLKFDSKQIEEQILLRAKAKQEKNWQFADKIRKDLLSNNIVLEDKSDGTTIWRHE